MASYTELGTEVFNGFAEAAQTAFSDWSHTDETLLKVAAAGALAYGLNKACMASGAAGIALREVLPVLSVSSLSDVARNLDGSRSARDVGAFGFDVALTSVASRTGGALAYPRQHIEFSKLQNPVHENVKIAQLFENRRNSPFFDSVDTSTRFPHLVGTQRAEVVVVGGGIGGILAANELSRAGIKCALVEAGPLASATTGNGCSMLTRVPDVEYSTLKQQYGDNVLGNYLNTLKKAHSRIKSIIESHPCDFEKYRSYKISYEKNSPHLKEEFEILRAHDPDVTLMNAQAASKIFGPAQSAMALHGEGSVNPRKLALELASTGKFKVFENSRVTGVSYSHPAKPIEVHTESGKILADKVVFATGGPAPMFEHLHEHLTPVQCFASVARVPNKGHGNFFDDREPDFSYFRQFGEGRLFFGGVARFPSKDVPAVESNPQLNERLQALFPGAKLEKQWTGTIFSTTQDGMPIVDRHPKNERIFNITGLGGIGLVNGQAAATELRQVITDNNNNGIFSSRRFATAAQSGAGG